MIRILWSDESYRRAEADALFELSDRQLSVVNLHRAERVNFDHLLSDLHVGHSHENLTHKQDAFIHIPRSLICKLICLRSEHNLM